MAIDDRGRWAERGVRPAAPTPEAVCEAERPAVEPVVLRVEDEDEEN